MELCRAFLTATRALLVAATEGDDLLVAQALCERAGLLAALNTTGPLTKTARSRCLELLQQAQQIEQDARARLAEARADVLAELRTLQGGRHALHAYRTAARGMTAAHCLDQIG
jgi:hypothetical protein